MGPRGLGAIEALCRLPPAAGVQVAIDAYDEAEHPGAGPNFSLDEPKECLLNLPIRSVALPRPAAGAGVGGFAEWLGDDGEDRDRFPARAELGAYLSARFAELTTCLPDWVSLSLRRASVSALKRMDAGWVLDVGGERQGPYREVLIVPGQPATRPDPVLERWRAFAAERGLDLAAAYPGGRLLDAAAGWAGKSVGVRGLGLSTLDIVRMLTLGLGGRFRDGGYVRSGREPARIVAFSPDGQAPAPKPRSAEVDALYDLTDRETQDFADAFESALRLGRQDAVQAIHAAVSPPVLRILGRLGGEADADALAAWLTTETTSPGAQETGAAADLLRRNIGYADGAEPPTIGFVVGQAWRKLEAVARPIFRLGEPVPETAAALIAFDEGLKRYSYGPPIDTARQLLALIRAGVVRPCALEDSDVELDDDHWALSDAGERLRMDAMVDSVQPPPSLSAILDPALAGLMDAGLLTSAGEDLSADTCPDGQLVGRDGVTVPGLALLGRLALGSVIAPDSIHDCFGDSADLWAQGAIERLSA
ncbi:MAG: FAD/NAD(P)-binding protein [Alphaproteobacteria bacterium]